MNEINTERKKCFVQEDLFDWQKEQVRESVCRDSASKFSANGNDFCLLHYPSAAKQAEFLGEFERKIKASELDFSGVYFPDALYLKDFNFEKEVNFRNAVFTQKLYIINSKFNDKVSFHGTVFKRSVLIDDSEFKDRVAFNEAVFEEKASVYIRNTGFFQTLTFNYALINDYLAFDGSRTPIFQETSGRLDLRSARIKNPSSVSFYNVRLQPNWFINTNCKEFVFTACRWKDPEGNDLTVESELKYLKNFPLTYPHKVLTKACWEIAENHENNKSFSNASVFRRIANESKRREDFGGWKIWSFHWWYWLSSFYGESPLRALIVLMAIIILFAVSYMFTDFQQCPVVKSVPELGCPIVKLNFGEAFRQSLTTATLQSIDYQKPIKPLGENLILFERILAPLQAALLALAIRRKFMR